MIPPIVIGSIGAGLLLIGFVLDQVGVLEDESPILDVLNLFGAGALTWYAILLVSWPFIILEAIWAGVAGWYLVRRLARRGKTG